MTTTTVAPARPKRKLSETIKNFWLDIALFIAFIVDMNTRFTGIPIHEWLGIGFGIALIFHLLWHWNWIAATTKRLIKKLPTVQRLRYILDVLLFVDMVVVIATGIWISEVAIRQLGITMQPSPFFRQLHHVTADWVIWLVALHIALDWKWLVASFKRYVWQPWHRRHA